MKFNIYGKILLKLDDRVLLHLQIANIFKLPTPRLARQLDD